MSVEHNAAYAIRVRHLWHRFGAYDVLRDVSFDVGHGEIFGFIGPNGAGKTTTIRVISTLLEPMAGRVEVDGYDVAIDPDKVRRLIGYMPDHAGVYERVTVREYLEFFADAYGVSSGGKNYAVVEAVLELTDLAKLESKLVATMSKGMKQRLQLGRVLLHDPKVLILDEPASDLDPRARIEMRDLLVELRKMGKTVFLSSHILTELADVCTSVAILERGRLVVSGPISEIAERLARARESSEAPERTVVAGAVTTGETPAPEIAPQRALARVLRVRVLASGEAVQAALSVLPFVEKAGAGPGGTIAVTYSGDDMSIASIVKTLVEAGIPVCGVEPERNELERIFLEVTKGDLQ
jgi:ABC-2 type transport system ATP-binding protein